MNYKITQKLAYYYFKFYILFFNKNFNLKKEMTKIFSRDKIYLNIYNRWRFYEALSCIFSMSGVVLAIIDYEIDIMTFIQKIDPTIYDNALKHPRNVSDTQDILRWINIFTTSISLTCLFLRHYYKRVWQNTFYDDD